MTEIQFQPFAECNFERMEAPSKLLVSEGDDLPRTLLRLDEVCYALRHEGLIGLCSSSDLEKDSSRTSMELIGSKALPSLKLALVVE